MLQVKGDAECWGLVQRSSSSSRMRMASQGFWRRPCTLTDSHTANARHSHSSSIGPMRQARTKQQHSLDCRGNQRRLCQPTHTGIYCRNPYIRYMLWCLVAASLPSPLSFSVRSSALWPSSPPLSPRLLPSQTSAPPLPLVPASLQQPQRIYGTAWESSDQLAAYNHLKAEAARRDHRKLGQELNLFSIQEEAGA